MKWTTAIPLVPELELNYKSEIIGLGSCFVEHIGRKFQEGKFQFRMNPFGILYHPMAIMESLERIVKREMFQAEELFLHQELWHSWSHHGCFSDVNQSAALSAINTEITAFHTRLQTANYGIITLGTAYVYEHIQSGKLVANCHKVPASEFRKYRLGVDEIVEECTRVMTLVRALNPNLQWIFTVSPVRHIRDGMIENQRSKATLLLAAEQVCQQMDAHYFPSYEIVMDELRDYRFYQPDLVHPNVQAVDYIWEQFRKFCFAPKTQEEYSQVLKVVRGFQHRGLHPNTSAYRRFLERHLATARKMQAELSVDFSDEIQVFQDSLDRLHE